MSDGVNADQVELALGWLTEAGRMRVPDLKVGQAIIEMRENRADVLERCARELLRLGWENAT